MEKTELMRRLWELAEEAEAKGDRRENYLLTLAGNLVEATFTSGPADELLRNADANANEIAWRGRRRVA